jgi:hypothetical protein
VTGVTLRSPTGIFGHCDHRHIVLVSPVLGIHGYRGNDVSSLTRRDIMSKQPSENEIVRQEASDPRSIELNDQQLDAVVGGRLYEAACKGTHLPKVKIG